MPKKSYRSATLPAVMYHVRSHDGVSLHMMDFRAPAIKRAQENRARCYELDRTTGRAVRIA